jgi:hypothetical protein
MVLCQDLCEESEEIFSENNWSLGLDLNLGPAEYEEALLTTTL